MKIQNSNITPGFSLPALVRPRLIIAFALTVSSMLVGQARAQGPPHIVSTSPSAGETEISPGLTEITVTFDRDMGGGFSWTGGGPEYPGSPEGKPYWRDKRTCVLPVRLAPGRYYQV